MHRVKVRVVEDALDANNTIARANRDDFDRAGVTVVNLMSAPGAGKTTLLERVLGRASATCGPGVLEGDVQGSLRRRPARGPARARSSQLNTEPGLRRRVPPRRQHGALGAAGAARSTSSTCWSSRTSATSSARPSSDVGEDARIMVVLGRPRARTSRSSTR